MEKGAAGQRDDEHEQEGAQGYVAYEKRESWGNSHAGGRLCDDGWDGWKAGDLRCTGPARLRELVWRDRPIGEPAHRCAAP
ncbi:hypothetical protein GCM10009105_17960 [Dokdonella soli]|uniref:Uncharacterized protein n=1 Tax=Dokdonella soli TaxID=529810 RepID=A0ABP3TSA9_9GAMM